MRDHSTKSSGMISFSPRFSVLLSENSIFSGLLQNHMLQSAAHSLRQGLVDFSVDISRYFSTALHSTPCSWKGWLFQALANSKKLPSFRQTMTLFTQVGRGKNIIHVQPEMHNRVVSSNLLSSGSLVLYKLSQVWGDGATTLWLWNSGSENGSEIFWEYRISEIIHLAFLPEVGNFAAHPFVFVKYGSWKAGGVGYNWKCLRPQLKKLQYQSQNAVRGFFIISLWLLLLTVLHFLLAFMI